VISECRDIVDGLAEGNLVKVSMNGTILALYILPLSLPELIPVNTPVQVSVPLKSEVSKTGIFNLAQNSAAY
jgi:hypothetical protein